MLYETVVFSFNKIFPRKLEKKYRKWNFYEKKIFLFFFLLFKLRENPRLMHINKENLSPKNIEATWRG